MRRRPQLAIRVLSRGSGSPTLVVSVEKPVAAANHDRTETAFGAIVIYFRVAALGVAQQRFPAGQRVVDRYTHRALGQHLRLCRLQVILEVL